MGSPEPQPLRCPNLRHRHCQVCDPDHDNLCSLENTRSLMGVVMSALLTAASEADLQERRAPPPAGAVPVPHVPCPRAKPPPVPSASQEEYAKIIWKEYNVNYDSGGTSFYPYVVEARREPRPMRPALRATRWLVAAVCVPTTPPLAASLPCRPTRG